MAGRDQTWNMQPTGKCAQTYGSNYSFSFLLQCYSHWLTKQQIFTITFMPLRLSTITAIHFWAWLRAIKNERYFASKTAVQEFLACPSDTDTLYWSSMDETRSEYFPTPGKGCRLAFRRLTDSPNVKLATAIPFVRAFLTSLILTN